MVYQMVLFSVTFSDPELWFLGIFKGEYLKQETQLSLTNLRDGSVVLRSK